MALSVRCDAVKQRRCTPQRCGLTRRQQRAGAGAERRRQHAVGDVFFGLEQQAGRHAVVKQPRAHARPVLAVDDQPGDESARHHRGGEKHRQAPPKRQRLALAHQDRRMQQCSRSEHTEMPVNGLEQADDHCERDSA